MTDAGRPPPTVQEIEALAAELDRLQAAIASVGPAVQAIIRPLPDGPGSLAMLRASDQLIREQAHRAGQLLRELEEALADHAIRVWVPHRLHEMLPALINHPDDPRDPTD